MNVIGESKASSQTTNRQLVRDICEKHNQKYTNFCSSNNCIKPLCPQCIDNHYLYHKDKKSQPQIDSIKTLRNKCLKKIKIIVDKIKDKSNINKLNKYQQIYQQSIIKINQVKKNTIEIIQKYFQKLYQQNNNYIEKYKLQYKFINQQIEKIHNINNQLISLKNKLENTNQFLDSVQNVCKIDVNKIQNNIDRLYNSIKYKNQSIKKDLLINNNYQEKIYQFFKNIINFSKQYQFNHITRLDNGQINVMVNSYANHQNYIQKSHSSNLKNLLNQQIQKNYQPRRSSQILARFIKQQNNKNSKIQQWTNQSKQTKKNYFKQQRSRISQQRQKSPNSQISDLNHSGYQTEIKRVKRRQKSILQIPKLITVPDSFKQNSSNKYLHFFQNDQNILNILDLQQIKTFKKLKVVNNFAIPQFHKSISLSNGDLYLIGGSIPQTGFKSHKIYQYDFSKNYLKTCGSLLYGRSSHSVCALGKYIYILGGINNQGITNTCQRFNIISNSIQEIRPMKYKACSFACCSYAERWIYKFGGLSQDLSISNIIEFYDQKTQEWNIIKPIVNSVIKKYLLSTSLAVQINQEEIMILGGYDSNNQGKKLTYFLNVPQNIIIDVNDYPLPAGEGFWNNHAIIHNRQIFMLQNIANGKDQCIENIRRVILFNGKQLRALN